MEKTDNEYLESNKMLLSDMEISSQKIEQWTNDVQAMARFISALDGEKPDDIITGSRITIYVNKINESLRKELERLEQLREMMVDNERKFIDDFVEKKTSIDAKSKNRIKELLEAQMETFRSVSQPKPPEDEDNG